jgi:hypothetical protein
MLNRYLIKAMRSLHIRLLVLEGSAPVLRLQNELGDITVNDSTNSLIPSESDDGFLVKMHGTDSGTGEHVLKIYKQGQAPDEFYQEKYKAVAKDQVTREFKALTLLKGHPNVPFLISTEVDTCTLHMDQKEPLKSWLIDMEYIPDMSHINEFSLGYPERVVEDDGSISVDFTLMHRLVDYIYGQAASLAHAMRVNGIEHRDIDWGNFMIQPHTLRLCLIDFARAKLPGLPDPTEIVRRCEAVLDLAESTKEDRALAEYKKKRYMTNNMNGVFELRDRAEVSEALLLFYWITQAFLRFCKLRKDYLLDNEGLGLLMKLNKLRVIFDTDVRPLLHFARPIVEDLAVFKKSHDLSRTRQGRVKLSTSKWNSVVHSAENEEAARSGHNISMYKIDWG